MSPDETGSQPGHSPLLARGIESDELPTINNRLLWSHSKQEVPNGTDVTEGTLSHRTATASGHQIAKAAAYMLQHLDEPLAMPTISKWTGLSLSSFYHRFKCVTGYTPNNFLIRARIRSACEMFRESDLNVKEVAALLGYQDQFYFSRLFKSVTGMPPREYRSLYSARKQSKPKPAPAASGKRTLELQPQAGNGNTFTLGEH